MASGAELGLACFTAFKEVYLLGKFVHKTIQSAQNSVRERDDLCKEFRHEMLWLQSFGRVYIQNNGVMDDQGLDAAWLRDVKDTMERLRLVFMDYAKLAGTEDEDYRKFSPYLTTSEPSRTIEFSLDLDESSTPSASLMTNVIQLKGRFGWMRSQPMLQSKSWKWALWQRPKFKRVLRDFKSGMALLKDLVPLSIAANPRYSKLTPQDLVQYFLRMGIDGERIGLRSYLEIRQTNLLDAEEQPSEFDEIVRRQEPLQGTAAPEYEDRLLTTGTLVPLIAVQPPSPVGTASGSVAPFQSAARQHHGVVSVAPIKVEHVFIEYKNYDLRHDTQLGGSNSELVRRPSGEEEILRLSDILHKANAFKLQTLPFRGYLNETQKQRFAFIFDYPKESDGSRPVSLNNIIRDNNNNLALPIRFAIAQRVATSLGAFHAIRWVHKSIRSHSVLFFREKNSMAMTYRDPYLVGFEFSRPETGPTNMIGDDVIEYNLYRHKDRLWENPTTAFNRKHDIYALGVVLLEIGLWKTAQDIYAEFGGERPGKHTTGEQLKTAYLKAAKMLPHLIGEGFSTAVMACLTAGDKGASLLARGNPMPDTEGPEAMLFQKKVVRNLDMSRIGGIDDDEEDEEEDEIC